MAVSLLDRSSLSPGEPIKKEGKSFIFSPKSTFACKDTYEGINIGLPVVGSFTVEPSSSVTCTALIEDLSSGGAATICSGICSGATSVWLLVSSATCTPGGREEGCGDA